MYQAIAYPYLKRFVPRDKLFLRGNALMGTLANRYKQSGRQPS